MKNILPKNLIDLANLMPKPLYVVGGAVRNFLIDGSLSTDIDLAGAISTANFIEVLNGFGIRESAVYPRTGTVMFSDGVYRYEYTAFRRDKYSGGEHLPEQTEFTEDINEDALRRDFKCNAVYYDVKKDKIIDLLGGVEDIKNKTLSTVCEPDKVFSVDGLRLMRLARFAGELNFKPTYEVIQSAKKYADNILDISPERVFNELKMILVSNCKYTFSDPIGHYNALKILDHTRVLDKIVPELTEGRGMVQRADFHKYDVLEHSIRTVLYSHPSIRLGALFHDIGKPFCFLRDGYYYHHFDEGERIAERVLKRLKADKATISQVKFLVREHMVDLDCSMSEAKVRKFLVKHHERLDELRWVKQADFRASLEIESTAPTIVKWKKIYDKMIAEGTPFTLKDLKITAGDLVSIGYKDKWIGKELKSLFDYAVLHPDKNNHENLVGLAKKHIAKQKNKIL